MTGAIPGRGSTGSPTASVEPESPLAMFLRFPAIIPEKSAIFAP